MSFQFDSDDDAPEAKASALGAPGGVKGHALQEVGGSPLAATPAPGASFRYVFKVDITSPISSGVIGESKVIVHSVAVGGKWSSKGTMGLVSRTFGEEVAEDYASTPGALGDARFVAVSNRYSSGKLWVCNLYAQRATGKGPPELVWDALLAALVKVRAFATDHSAAVHIARLRSDVPNVDWPKVHDALVAHLVGNGVPVVVYSGERGDRARYGDTPTKVASPASPAPTITAPRTTIPPAAAPTLPAPAPSPGPLAEVLKGKNIVISGYPAPDMAALQAKVAEMGGTVQTKWKTWGAASHLLVCEAPTEEFVHVETLGGTVVTRAFLDRCRAAGRCLPVDAFLYRPNGSGSPAALAHAPPVPRPATPPPPKRPKTDGLTATSTPFDFPDVFTGMTICLCGEDAKDNPFNTQKSVARYIIAYGGQIAKTAAHETGAVTVVVGEQSAPVGAPSPPVAVSAAWVWDSVNRRTALPLAGYTLR